MIVLIIIIISHYRAQPTRPGLAAPAFDFQRFAFDNPALEPLLGAITSSFLFAWHGIDDCSAQVALTFQKGPAQG